MPGLHGPPEALAWCRRHRDIDALADVMPDITQTCASLLATQYGGPNGLRSLVAAVVQWLIDFARVLTTGH